MALRCSHAPVTPYGDPDKLWQLVQTNYQRPAGPYAASGKSAPAFGAADRTHPRRPHIPSWPGR